MINRKDFESIGRELKDFENKREETIQGSRIVIKLSKQIIYSVHRGDLANAGRLIGDIKTKVKTLSRKSYDTGISDVAFQEYVEAVVFYELIKNNKLPTRKQLGVDVFSYLSGLADLTGELVRKAVHEAIKKNFKVVFKMKDIVEDIYGEFLKFDLRNGELRKKSDAIRWNFNKLEDLIVGLK